jgi:tetratricopeptide (TPR) repeat protein
MITGFASPEGNIQMNNQLSRGRAEALRNFLSMRSGIPPRLYRIGNGGEDWDGLARMVQNSYIEPKGAILSIIRTYMGEERKDRLKALGGGAVYQRLLQEFYPKLRRVVSRIDYTVRGFNVEEAKQVIKVRPQQLSLNEMFLVANTYPEGSKEFMSVFEIAVRVFPNDPVANLNAAASALLEKDLAKAERYLQKAKKNTPAYYNNLGVLSMLQNNNARARNLFLRAAENKLDAARKNLDELRKKEEAEKQLINIHI